MTRFTSQWWSQNIRTLLWVALVTVLVWVYADMKFTDTRKFTTTLVLTTGKSNLELLSRDRLTVNFEVQSSRESLDRFERSLQGELTVDIPKEAGTGERFGVFDFPTTELLTKITQADRAGLRVTSATPSVLTVSLDRKDIHEVPVIFESQGAALAKPPEVQPSQVAVSIGRARWKRILELLGPDNTPALRTRTVDLSNVPPDGPREFQNVEIIPNIAGERVEPARQAVSVIVQISQRTDLRKFTASVRLQFPHTWIKDNVWSEFVFEGQGEFWWRKDITVSGPIQSLDQLKPEDIDAYIVLTDNDKAPVSSWLSRPVQFRFPPGLNLKLEGDRPVVNFRLVRQGPESATPSPAVPAGQAAPSAE